MPSRRAHRTEPLVQIFGESPKGAHIRFAFGHRVFGNTDVVLNRSNINSTSVSIDHRHAAGGPNRTFLVAMGLLNGARGFGSLGFHSFGPACCKLNVQFQSAFEPLLCTLPNGITARPEHAQAVSPMFSSPFKKTMLKSKLESHQ